MGDIQNFFSLLTPELPLHFLTNGYHSGCLYPRSLKNNKENDK